jgi:hypothetical protein
MYVITFWILSVVSKCDPSRLFLVVEKRKKSYGARSCDWEVLKHRGRFLSQVTSSQKALCVCTLSWYRICLPRNKRLFLVVEKRKKSYGARSCDWEVFEASWTIFFASNFFTVSTGCLHVVMVQDLLTEEQSSVLTSRNCSLRCCKTRWNVWTIGCRCTVSLQAKNKSALSWTLMLTRAFLCQGELGDSHCFSSLSHCPYCKPQLPSPVTTLVLLHESLKINPDFPHCCNWPLVRFMGTILMKFLHPRSLLQNHSYCLSFLCNHSDSKASIIPPADFPRSQQVLIT